MVRKYIKKGEYRQFFYIKFVKCKKSCSFPIKKEAGNLPIQKVFVNLLNKELMPVKAI